MLSQSHGIDIFTAIKIRVSDILTAFMSFHAVASAGVLRSHPLRSLPRRLPRTRQCHHSRSHLPFIRFRTSFFSPSSLHIHTRTPNFYQLPTNSHQCAFRKSITVLVSQPRTNPQVRMPPQPPFPTPQSPSPTPPPEPPSPLDQNLHPPHRPRTPSPPPSPDLEPSS